MQGKRRQAITECALAACMLLHSRGLLRPGQGCAADAGDAPQVRSKRSRRGVRSDDEDEDEFFDRTGDVQRTRDRKRRKPESVLTYDSVARRVLELQQSLEDKAKAIADLQGVGGTNASLEAEDSLDAFMSDVISTERRQRTKRLQAEQTTLSAELVQMTALAERLKPASLALTMVPPSGPPPTAQHAESKRSIEADALAGMQPRRATKPLAPAFGTAFQAPKASQSSVDASTAISQASQETDTGLRDSALLPPPGPRFMSPASPGPIENTSGGHTASHTQDGDAADDDDIKEDGRPGPVDESVGGLILRKVCIGLYNWYLRGWKASNT